ncbi:thioredoxin family protein [Streptomyces sp. NPDC101455]|uniref:thioredoxin family protein n=1 Tax=Streptomyces sp. NPDC101455 TaxID=3366142 RepID=UPI00380A89F8
MLYVYADWSGPSQDLKPLVEEVAAELGDRSHLLELDYDQAEQPEQARRKYALDADPTLLVTVGGVPVARIPGAMEKDEPLSQLHPLLRVRSVGEGTPASPRRPEDVNATPQG